MKMTYKMKTTSKNEEDLKSEDNLRNNDNLKNEDDHDDAEYLVFKVFRKYTSTNLAY